MGKCLMSYQVSVLQGEKILETGYTAKWIYLTQLNCALRNGLDDKFYIKYFYHN